MNNVSDTTRQIQENRDRVNALIEYKKKIAKWLEIYPDNNAQTIYSQDTPIPTKQIRLKSENPNF